MILAPSRARSFASRLAVRPQREDRSARCSSRRLSPSTQRVIQRVAPRALESTRINSLGKWSSRRTRRAGRRNTVKRVDATIRRYLSSRLPRRSILDDVSMTRALCHPYVIVLLRNLVRPSPSYHLRFIPLVYGFIPSSCYWDVSQGQIHQRPATRDRLLFQFLAWNIIYCWHSFLFFKVCVYSSLTHS